MKLYKSDKVRFISGLIFIIVIYSWNYFYFVESNDYASMPKIVIHLISFLVTVAVYLVGTFHLGKLKASWMSSLWHLIHISGLCIIVFLTFFDWFIAEISLALKHFAYSIQEALISPVLYFAMGLLNKSLNK